MSQPDLAAIAAAFRVPGSFVGARRYGSGHINDTYLLEHDEGGRRAFHVLQRVNHLVFQDPAALMENVRRVLAHLESKLDGLRDKQRRMLTLVPARDGRPFHRDPAGNYWRLYVHIQGGRTYDVVESPRQAFEAAKAFGAFQQQLADLKPPRLHETIPGFHDTPKRYEAFERAVAADAAGRARLAREEIEFARRRETTTRALEDLRRRGDLPERIAHNDTKFNNVIIDDETGEGLCVIDLDTVMPGLALHDFGDMARAIANPAAEDETDLSKVEISLPHFEALARGYLSAAGGFLTPVERAQLPMSARVLALELGLRFLTDYLAGDVYFKTHRPDHNLDRCRTQLKLVASLEERHAALKRVVEQADPRPSR